MLGDHEREVLGSLTCSWGPSCPRDTSGPFTLGRGSLCLTLFSPPGEEFYEASPYEPVTSRLSDIFRLASIFSGKWARAGASLVLLFPLGLAQVSCEPLYVSELQVLICKPGDVTLTQRCPWSRALVGTAPHVPARQQVLNLKPGVTLFCCLFWPD